MTSLVGFCCLILCGKRVGSALGQALAWSFSIPFSAPSFPDEGIVKVLRYIPEAATVADIGVGVGHYSELLARRGSNIHLVDVASRLLDAAQVRLTSAGLGEHILSITNASATDLSFIPDESCDAVLMLGPFYNLSLLAERRQADAEARRILRQGGLLFVAGINRMTMLHWIFKDGPESILEE